MADDRHEGRRNEDKKKEGKKVGKKTKGQRVFFLNFNLRVILPFHKIVGCTSNIVGYT